MSVLHSTRTRLLRISLMTGVCLLLNTAATTYFASVLTSWSDSSDLFKDCKSDTTANTRDFDAYGLDEGDRYLSHWPAPQFVIFPDSCYSWNSTPKHEPLPEYQTKEVQDWRRGQLKEVCSQENAIGLINRTWYMHVENIRIFFYNAQRTCYFFSTSPCYWDPAVTKKQHKSAYLICSTYGEYLWNDNTSKFFFKFNPFDAPNSIYYLKMHSLVLQSYFSNMRLFMQRPGCCPTSGSADYGSILHRASSCCNDCRT